MFRKCLSILFSLIVVVSIFTTIPFSANAKEVHAADTGVANGEVGIWSWTLDDDNVLTISGYGDMMDFDRGSLPWSNYVNTITKVIINDGITSIGSCSFCDFNKLNSVIISDSVTRIGDGAFCECGSLSSVTIPDSVKTIGNNAFVNCTGLTSVSIGNSVSSISEYAFAHCESLSSVTIPDSVITIGDDAFYCCGLTSVSIGNSVTNIGSDAFSGCYNLSSLSIGNSVTSIGAGAFDDCNKLTEVSIPDSVMSIGEYAFDHTAWYDNQPDGLVYAGNVAYKMKGNDCPSEIKIKDYIVGIAGYAFHDCNFSSVIIPDSVTNIGNYAFYRCSNLKSITIPSSVTSIGLNAIGFSRPGRKIKGFTIYGYSGTISETYANENGFPFIALSDITDNNTNIVLSVPKDTTVHVKEQTEELSGSFPDGSTSIAAYDISLKNGEETVQPQNAVTVKIPCANMKAKVYRKEANGTYTNMDAVYRDGYLIFITNHFSCYVIAADRILGDIDCNGEIEIRDTTFIQRKIADIILPFTIVNETADIDGDKQVTLMDATLIQRWLANLKSNDNIGKQIG